MALFNSLFFIFRLLFLITSNIGSWELLRKKTKVDIFFIPSLTVALQTCILFFAGILNLLLETTIFLSGFGLIYLICCIYKEKNFRFIKNYFNAGYLFLAAVIVLSAFALRGTLFTHYDDFSHWGMVVRRMLIDNRFPNFQNILIFKEYPLGSSIYIYYFSRILSSAESVQMTAQAYVMAACLLPLFSFCRKNSLPALLCLLSFTNLFFTFNIALSSLLVDTLLPIVSACSLLYLHKYCYSSSDSPEFFLAGAYLIQVAQIKNSGVLFVLIAAAWSVYRAIREHSYKNRVILMLMPLVSFYLWHTHCKYVLGGASASKHAMHPKYYKNIISCKSAEDFLTIPANVFSYILSYRDMWISIGFILVLGALICLFGRDYMPLWIKLGLFCGAVFMVYQFGLILMYLFSMPNYEASILAGIERYEKTCVIFITYMMLPVGMKILDSLASKKASSYALSACMITIPFVFSFLSAGRISSAWNNYIGLSSEEWIKERNWFEKQIVSYDIPDESTYCVLIPHGDAGFTYYMSVFRFNSDNVKVKVINNSEELDNTDSQYIIVYDSQNEIIRDWISLNYPDQTEKNVIIQN